ncbi:MAG: hypothetical protein E7184_00130 [Erysipelotrichaceae bacterium]|nr:hypothetical protein [Erysipelotrichaceae bacterium]
MTSKEKIDSKGILETWKDTFINFFHKDNHKVINEDYEIIKNDLDRLEELEQEKLELSALVDKLQRKENKWYSKYSKLEKVIDFIKNYNFDIEDFIYHTTYEQYFNYYFTNYKCLISEEVPTEEQYNLVKEVFG